MRLFAISARIKTETGERPELLEVPGRDAGHAVHRALIACARNNPDALGIEVVRCLRVTTQPAHTRSPK